MSSTICFALSTVQSRPFEVKAHIIRWFAILMLVLGSDEKLAKRRNTGNYYSYRRFSKQLRRRVQREHIQVAISILFQQTSQDISKLSFVLCTTPTRTMETITTIIITERIATKIDF